MDFHNFIKYHDKMNSCNLCQKLEKVQYRIHTIYTGVYKLRAVDKFLLGPLIATNNPKMNHLVYLL